MPRRRQGRVQPEPVHLEENFAVPDNGTVNHHIANCPCVARLRTMTLEEEALVAAYLLQLNGIICTYFGVVSRVCHNKVCGWPMIVLGLLDYFFASRRLLCGLLTENTGYLKQWIFFTCILVVLILFGMTPLVVEDLDSAGLLQALPWFLVVVAEATVHLLTLILIYFMVDLLDEERLAEDEEERMDHIDDGDVEFEENIEAAAAWQVNACDGCDRQRGIVCSRKELRAARRLNLRVKKRELARASRRETHSLQRFEAKDLADYYVQYLNHFENNVEIVLPGSSPRIRLDLVLKV